MNYHYTYTCLFISTHTYENVFVCIYIHINVSFFRTKHYLDFTDHSWGVRDLENIFGTYQYLKFLLQHYTSYLIAKNKTKTNKTKTPKSQVISDHLSSHTVYERQNPAVAQWTGSGLESLRRWQISCGLELSSPQDLTESEELAANSFLWLLAGRSASLARGHRPLFIAM